MIKSHVLYQLSYGPKEVQKYKKKQIINRCFIVFIPFFISFTFLMFTQLNSCTICPRQCRVNRNLGETGYCTSDAAFRIASICIHQGEEPAISGEYGICNIFFPHCNLQCVYCQNHQISRNNSVDDCSNYSLPEVADQVCAFLNAGCKSVGFVTPTHYFPHVHEIIDALHEKGHHPVIVYNTNGYEKVEMLQTLETKIDVYLPDFKYINSETAHLYSDAKNYPDIIKLSIKEMYRQKGSSVIMDDEGIALQGMIIRHLVLPGKVEESKAILRWIASELSSSVYLSLMAQYNPPAGIDCPYELKRKITTEEYESVVREMEDLGFHHGWVQELDSYQHYNPDFTKDKPFL
jgi:putative pyruvate formate lyase activating enzyme